MDTPIVVALAEALARAGLCALRFDFRGIGASTGTASGGLSEHLDVRAAESALRGLGVGRVALCGYSFGALMAARSIAEREGDDVIEALAAVALPTVIVGDHADRIAHVRAALTRVPTLLVAGTRDPFVEPARLAAWAAPSTETLILDGEGHFYSDAVLDRVTARVADFLAARLR